jgi:hypothetical protein
MHRDVLALLAVALGVAGVLAAAVALVVPERRLRRWSMIAFAFAAADAILQALAPSSTITRVALLAAMLACALPAARWVFTALVDASSD